MVHNLIYSLIRKLQNLIHNMFVMYSSSKHLTEKKNVNFLTTINHNII